HADRPLHPDTPSELFVIELGQRRPGGVQVWRLQTLAVTLQMRPREDDSRRIRLRRYAPGLVRQPDGLVVLPLVVQLVRPRESIDLRVDHRGSGQTCKPDR